MKFRHRGVVRLASGIDHDGPLRAQLIEVKAHRIADAPLDPIAHHGLPQGAGSREADARSGAFGLAQTKSGKQGAAEPRTLVVNSSEVLRTQQTDTFRKTRDEELPLVTDGKFLPSGGAAAGENGPAVLGFHPRTKTMGLRAVTIIRLESTFRHLISIGQYIRVTRF